MKNNKFYLQLFLIFVVMTATVLIFTKGSRYLAGAFEDSQSFQYEAEQFVSGLVRQVLKAPTEQDFEEALTASEEEITHYRTYYGTLAQQIQSIKDQYAGDLETAQDTDVREALEQERDAKIADIKKNFEDDEYVKEKIIAMKKKAVQQELKSLEREKRELFTEYSYFAYEFIDEKTGVVYRDGDVEKPNSFQQTFTNIGDKFEESYTIDFSAYDSTGSITGSYTAERDLSGLSGIVTIPQEWFINSHLGKEKQAFYNTKFIYFAIIIAGILSFVLLMTVLEPAYEQFGRKFQLRAQFERLPVDLRIIGALLAAYLAFLFNGGFISSIQTIIYYRTMERYNFWFDFFCLGVLSFVLMTAVIFMVVSIWESLKQRDLMKVWPHTFTAKFVRACIAMFENRSMGLQSLLLLTVIFLGGFGFAVVVLSGDTQVLLFYMFLFVLFFIPALYLFMRRIGYLNRIMQHTEHMAQGRLTKDLKVKGKSPLAKHAAHLNGLREGVRTSMNEQAKSEQMKTELITNVSHDLRTPLTSIITYTDLLKNPAITAEERQKYIAILDAKSNRLKTLIEDLFEVSKMASGNVEIDRQRIDLAQLLQQAVGEHGEDFAAAQLDLRVNIAEQPIYAAVDGQKWWRVIDNLIVNARKYSLAGTRVYVNLKAADGQAELTVKNVAKYELHEEASELIERFKRADTSRHTEGSGLGLAIAQSIVDLHGGQLIIAVDGDLFKVTVLIRTEK